MPGSILDHREQLQHACEIGRIRLGNDTTVRQLHSNQPVVSPLDRVDASGHKTIFPHDQLANRCFRANPDWSHRRALATNEKSSDFARMSPSRHRARWKNTDR